MSAPSLMWDVCVIQMYNCIKDELWIYDRFWTVRVESYAHKQPLKPLEAENVKHYQGFYIPYMTTMWHCGGVIPQPQVHWEIPDTYWAWLAWVHAQRGLNRTERNSMYTICYHTIYWTIPDVRYQTSTSYGHSQFTISPITILLKSSQPLCKQNNNNNVNPVSPLMPCTSITCIIFTS